MNSPTYRKSCKRGSVKQKVILLKKKISVYIIVTFFVSLTFAAISKCMPFYLDSSGSLRECHGETTIHTEQPHMQIDSYLGRINTTVTTDSVLGVKQAAMIDKKQWIILSYIHTHSHP